MYIPVVIPDIVMAVALLMFYSLVRERLGLLELGMTTMMLAHVTFQIPFVAIVVRSRMVGMDPAIEEAAHDLGATVAADLPARHPAADPARRGRRRACSPSPSASTTSW